MIEGDYEKQVDMIMLMKDVSLSMDYVEGRLSAETLVTLYNINQRYKNPKFDHKVMVLDEQDKPKKMCLVNGVWEG